MGWGLPTLPPPRVGPDVPAGGLLALSLAGTVGLPAAAAHPAAAAAAAVSTRSTGRPVPPAVARRLATLARSAQAGTVLGSLRAAGVRPIPDSDLSTDLPTRLPVEDPYLPVPFTIVVPVNTYRRPLVVVELFNGAQVSFAAGFCGSPGQTRYQGVAILDTGSIRDFGEALWVFGVVDDADQSGETGDIGALPAALKLRSLLGERVTRSGDTVRVFGSAKGYDPTVVGGGDDGRDGAFVPRVGQTVYLQRYTSSGWATLRTLRTDARGHVDVHLRLPFRAGLRLTARDTATTFGAPTAPTVS